VRKLRLGCPTVLEADNGNLVIIGKLDVAAVEAVRHILVKVKLRSLFREICCFRLQNHWSNVLKHADRTHRTLHAT
jgi:hypothetical protein